MNTFKAMQERIDAVVEENRKNEATTTKEERKAAFMKVAVDLFNEEIAGDVTLADGRTITIPKI